MNNNNISNKILDDYFLWKYDICPHCRKTIGENEYTEDAGKTWKHIDCKKIIKENINNKNLLLEKPTKNNRIKEKIIRYFSKKYNKDKLKEFINYMKSLSDKDIKNIYNTYGKEIEGIGVKKEGWILTGKYKYAKQEPGGTFSTSNVGSPMDVT